MNASRFVITALLACFSGGPACAEESPSLKTGMGQNATSRSIATGDTAPYAPKRLHFIDEDGDGINDIVQDKAGFSDGNNSIRNQTGYGMLMDGAVQRIGGGAAGGSGARRNGFRK